MFNINSAVWCVTLEIDSKKRLQETLTPKVIDMMSKCLKLETILQEGNENERIENLKNIALLAKIENTACIVNQYNDFASRIRSVVNYYVDFKLIFTKHVCNEKCGQNCSKLDDPNFMKIIHLFLKEPELYTGIKNFLHLFMNCIVKTHAESVAESMGSIIERHCDSRRGSMGLEDVGKEAFVSWNGPPIHE